MTGPPHVIWDNLTPRDSIVLLPDQQLVMCCLHCGDRYVAALPASVGMAGAVCGQYAKEHRLCKPRETKP